MERVFPRSPNAPEHVGEIWPTLVSLAERLAAPFPHVRVDFYIVGDRILVGELTFIPGNALSYFEPAEWDARLGDLWELDLSRCRCRASRSFASTTTARNLAR